MREARGTIERLRTQSDAEEESQDWRGPMLLPLLLQSLLLQFSVVGFL